MLYRGYDVESDICVVNSRGKPAAVKRVLVRGIRDFDPVHIFECGQCFRWSKEPDGSYTGVVRGKVANVSYAPGMLVINNATMEDFKDTWFDYFDLGRDYGMIKKAVITDEIMEKAVEFGSGIRLLRQEPWEVLVSFIISANNRISRIKRNIHDISRLFGEEKEYGGKKYYCFPDAEKLASLSLEQVMECRAGYRCEYIIDTARAAAAGEFDPEKLGKLDADEARKALKHFKGVGDKVADCILLYSGTRYDVFPVDVWVKRVMQELYFGRDVGLNEIRMFARDRFGRYAGFAQQYLFYYAREHKIGA
ncbi:MAG: DNA-3-methyladenine glycosylase family protein [Bacillota bacterium]